MTRRRIVIAVILLGIVCSLVYRKFHTSAAALGKAYVIGNSVTLWNSTAQVRLAVTALRFGEQVQVLQRAENSAEIRTPSGQVGWVGADQLLEPNIWLLAKDLAANAKRFPVEGRGHTRVVSNLRIGPGRGGARILQLRPGVPVLMLERRVAELPSLTAREAEPTQPSSPRLEDWWLVRAQVEGIGEVAGWVLGRFIDLDLPDPLPSYMSGADLRAVAWFEINYVLGPNGVRKPEYLVLGTRKSQGDPCDFTAMDVFTWSPKWHRYETAYVERALCGKLPVEVNPAKKPGGDASFSFANISLAGKQLRGYEMRQTIVRRVRGAKAGRKSKGH